MTKLSSTVTSITCGIVSLTDIWLGAWFMGSEGISGPRGWIFPPVMTTALVFGFLAVMLALNAVGQDK